VNTIGCIIPRPTKLKQLRFLRFITGFSILSQFSSKDDIATVLSVTDFSLL